MNSLRVTSMVLVPLATLFAVVWLAMGDGGDVVERPPVVTTDVPVEGPEDDIAVVDTETPPDESATEEAPVDVAPAVREPTTVRDGRIVRLADGSPLEDARVEIMEGDSAIASATTDAEGRYQLATPAAARPTTVVVTWSTGTFTSSIDDVDEELTVDTGWSLRVQLVDPLGLAPREARVTLEDHDGRALAPLERDNDVWTARDLPVATEAQQQWHVTARAANTRVAITPITPMPFLAETRRLTMLLERAGSITAEVRVDDGRPAADAKLTIGSSDPPLTVTTGPDGRAALDHVPRGVHVVTGTWLDPVSQRTRRFHSEELFVESDRATDWSHVIRAGVTLAGRVVAVGGTPRPGLTLDIRSQISSNVEPLDGTVSTDGQGRFTIHDIDDGAKLLRVFDGEQLVAERSVFVPPHGLRDVVIAYGGHVWHDVTALDTRNAALPLVDVTLLASERDTTPHLAQSWQGVTAGLPRDDPDGPDLGGPSVVSGFQYVGTQAFRQTKLVHPRPLEAPPPGLSGPHVRTIEPPVDINLRAFFEPVLVPHAQTNERGAVTIDIDANRSLISVGGRALDSVPFGALASTADISVRETLTDWLTGHLDLWVVTSSAGRITEATPLIAGTSTSNAVTLVPAPLLVVRVANTTGRRLHDVNVVAEDADLGTRVTLETEPLGPAAFVLITDFRGNGRTLDVTIDVPDHKRATIPWTPGEIGAVEVIDVALTPAR